MAKTAQKPLFVPLNSEHYDNFHNGSKSFEMRQGPKRWNDKTVYTGRKVIISKGYGKQNRMIGAVGLVIKSYYGTSILTHFINGRELWQYILPDASGFCEANYIIRKMYPNSGHFIAFECLDLKEVSDDG